MDERYPVTGGFYRHFLRGLYQVVLAAEHDRTGEKLVVCQALSGDFSLTAFPAEDFSSEVDKNAYPQEQQKYVFEQVARDELSARQAQPQAAPANEQRGTAAQKAPKGQASPEELDSKLMDFFEARTYESKVAILENMRDDVTDTAIDKMATAVDIEIPQGELSERYHELWQCLKTMEHFESRRLR